MNSIQEKKARKLHTPRRVRGTPPGILSEGAPEGAIPCDFGAEVTRLRLARGWCQKKAGKALGISPARLCAIERGGVPNPKPYVRAGILAVLSGA